MDKDIFIRAERACAETRRLIGERVTGVEQTLTVLRRCAIRYEDALEVLERAIQRLEKAGWDSARERLADAARKPRAAVSTQIRPAANRTPSQIPPLIR